MDLVFDSDVKPANMKFALLALADNASHTGFCRPGVNYLAAKTGTSRSTMFRLLSQLESEHLIERRERRRSDGSRQANAYRINVELLRRRSRTVTPDEKDELEKLFQEESAEVGDMVPGCDGGGAVDLDDLDESIFASSRDETGAWVTSETGGSVAGDTGARPGDDTGKNRQEDRQPNRHGTHPAPEASRSASPSCEDDVLPPFNAPFEAEEQPKGCDAQNLPPKHTEVNMSAMVDSKTELPKESQIELVYSAGAGVAGHLPDEVQTDPFSGQEGDPDQVAGLHAGRRVRAADRSRGKGHGSPEAFGLLRAYCDQVTLLPADARNQALPRVSQLLLDGFEQQDIFTGITEILTAKIGWTHLGTKVAGARFARCSGRSSTAGQRISETESMRAQMQAMDAAESAGQLDSYGMRAIGGGE